MHGFNIDVGPYMPDIFGGMGPEALKKSQSARTEIEDLDERMTFS